MTATVSLAMLCADDYALTEGVSRGIEELARAGRLSATSALVTTRHWPDHARRVSELRRHVLVGLHLNLTLAPLLGPVPGISRDGGLSTINIIAAQTVARALDRRAIATEFARQIEAFRARCGSDPDFVDGHQHVHALPVVREALIAALVEAFPAHMPRPWVRDPADAAQAIMRRGVSTGKALALTLLAQSFGRAVRDAGFTTNRGFAGVSAFDRRVPYEDELAAQFRAPGPRHLIMCHPGHVDDELRLLDPVVERRADEFTALMTSPWLPLRIVTGGCHWPATGSEVAT